MTRFGNDEDGFAWSFDEGTCSMEVKAWGFWSRELALTFAKTVIDACASNRGTTCIVVDAVGLKPQREQGQAAFGALMAALPRLGILHASVRTDSPLTRLQLLRLAKEYAVTNLIQFPAPGRAM